MKIIEYKRHLIAGVVQDPDFISNGGVFHNPSNNTWVGKILDENERTYYVPDTLVELTRDELVARQLSINTSYPAYKKTNVLDPHSESVALTGEELTAQVDAWIAESV